MKKPGFAEGIRTGIRLVVGQDASADLSLRLGSGVQEEVKVNGDAPEVSVSTQDISGLVGRAASERSPTQRTKLRPADNPKSRNREFH